MKILSSPIKSIDTFSQPIQLTFDNKKKYPTIIGGILSLIIFGLCVALVFTIESELYNEEKPKISTTNKYFVDSPILSLIKKNITYAAYFYDKDFNVMFDPTILTLELEQFKVTRDDTGNTNYERKSIKTTNCSNYYNYYKERGFKNNFNMNSLSKAKCVDINNSEDISLGGNVAGNYFSNILFRINKCQNSTNSDIICKTPDVISKAIKGGSFEFHYLDNYIEINDYKNPFVSYYGKYFILLDPKAFKFVDMYYKQVNITSDGGLIFQDPQVNSSIVFDYFREQFDTSSSEEKVLKFYINSSKNVLLLTRNYRKFQDFAATIGGIIKVLMITGYVMSYKYTEYTMFEHMINHLYAFEDKDFTSRRSNFDFLNDILLLL